MTEINLQQVVKSQVGPFNLGERDVPVGRWRINLPKWNLSGIYDTVVAEVVGEKGKIKKARLLLNHNPEGPSFPIWLTSGEIASDNVRTLTRLESIGADISSVINFFRNIHRV